MTSYPVNPDGVRRAHRLIESRQYVIRSEWSDVQPDSDRENQYLDSHCRYRAAQWRHKEIELAAHDLLQELDRVIA